MKPDAVCRNCEHSKRRRGNHLVCNRLRDVLHLWFPPDVPEEFWCKEWIRKPEPPKEKPTTEIDIPQWLAELPDYMDGPHDDPVSCAYIESVFREK